MTYDRKQGLSDMKAAFEAAINWISKEMDTAGEAAVMADTFVEGIAVNTHLNWRSDAAWSGGQWKQPFLDLGVRYTRSGMFRNTGAINDWKSINAKLIYVTADGDQFTDKQAQIADTLNLLADNAGITAAVEGPNEPNEGHHAGWETRVRDFQQWLFNEVKKRSPIAQKPILSPSIWKREQSAYELLGDISSMITTCNLHYYTGGCKPTVTSEGPDSDSAGTLDEAISDAQGMGPGKPLWITETGWSVSGPNVPLDQWQVTDTAAAKYLLRMTCEAFRRGVSRTAIYTLFDDARTPPRYHGMMNRSWSKRPSYYSLKNMIAVFDDPGEAFTPDQIAFDIVGGLPVGINQMPIMQRRDGAFLFTFWQDADSYNRQTFRDNNVSPINITLDFGLSVRARTFAPYNGPDANDLPAGESVQVGVPDHPIVVEVTF